MADLELSQSSQYSGMKDIKSFKQFKVERELGKGGFGTVYLVSVKNDSSGKLYALKCIMSLEVIKKLDGDRERYNEMNKREIDISYIASELPHCLVMHHHFNEDDIDYYLYEVCPGGDLKDLQELQQDNRFTEAEVKVFAE